MRTPSNKITAHNAGWRSQFRFADGVLWPGVCEFHRSASMRFSASILVVLLFASGCATHHQAPTAKEISDKRDELYILGEEMPLLVRQLERLQMRLSTNGTYTAEILAHDLDCSLSAMRKAHDELAARYWRLVKEYHVDVRGSY
jgi:hypothetical protein